MYKRIILKPRNFFHRKEALIIMTSITIIGSLNYDLVTYTNKVPEGGETAQANAFENHLGGKGLNEAIAVARLTPSNSNINTRMIGNIGDDSFGKELKEALIEANVDVQYIKTLKNMSSGVAVIIVEEDSGENRILITSGANGELKPTEDEYLSYFPDSSNEGYVILQNEYPDTISSINWLKQNRPKLNVAYNPSPFKPEYIKSEVLSKIDLLIVNEGEALDVANSLMEAEEIRQFKLDISEDQIKGFGVLARKLTQLINQKNINLVVITMGSKGCIYASKAVEPEFERSIKVEHVVDTTGAGDTFFGGVVLKLATGATIADSIKFATKASSIVIQKKGAVESIPKIEDVE